MTALDDTPAWVDDDGRCRTTELLPDQCACRHHRGTPAAALDDTSPTGPVFEARYPGTCTSCGRHIHDGDRIRATDDGYRHDDCEETR